MKLEPFNIVCPACGSGNYMRHLMGKNVGYLDVKCINCNSYFNFDELYKRRIGEALKPKPQTNYDRLVSKTPEELATFFGTLPCCPPGNADELCFPDNTCGADTKMMVKCWGTWLKAPVEVDNG